MPCSDARAPRTSHSWQRGGPVPRIGPVPHGPVPPAVPSRGPPRLKSRAPPGIPGRVAALSMSRFLARIIGVARTIRRVAPVLPRPRSAIAAAGRNPEPPGYSPPCATDHPARGSGNLRSATATISSRSRLPSRVSRDSLGKSSGRLRCISPKTRLHNRPFRLSLPCKITHRMAARTGIGVRSRRPRDAVARAYFKFGNRLCTWLR